MKPLTEYSKNDHTFELIERCGNYGIFHGRSTKGSSETYEVIQIQSHNGTQWSDEPKEYPPSNNQWGSKGWTCVNLEDAKKRLTLMLENGTKSAEQK